jgi:hypothetical protein
VRTEAPSATTTTVAALATTSTRRSDLVYRAVPETLGPRATIAGGSGGAPPCTPRPTDGTYGADTAHPQRAPLQQSAVFAGGIRWAICGASAVNSADVLNLRSTDQGRTWTVSDTQLRFSPHHAGDQLTITLDSPMVGQIHIRSEVGLFDGTYATTDGGQTWRPT